jgi:RNA polymerase sigma-70 factor (ECF subfamily)
LARVRPIPGSASRPGAQSPKPAALTLVVDDRVVVERVRRGDATAFASIFHAHYDLLVDVAEGLVRSADDAEEIVADVFLAIWAQRDRWIVRDSVRAYLLGATRNRCLNHARQRRTRDRVHDRCVREGLVPGAGQNPAEADAGVRAGDLSAAIVQAVAGLPDRPREVITLYRSHRLSFAEIARLLGISPRTVEVHLARALKLLRHRLSPFLSVILTIL